MSITSQGLTRATVFHRSGHVNAQCVVRIVHGKPIQAYVHPKGTPHR